MHHLPSINAFIAFMFDSGQMARDRLGPDRDRLLGGRLTSIAQRHARWGDLTEDDKAAGVTELRALAGDRADLLAEAAGLALGTAEGKGDEYQAQAQAVAELCRLAGADETLIPQWTQIGRGRAEQAGWPPFARPGRTRAAHLTSTG